jgi:pimeloyl-ACP methyl ester carboxylesterase
MLRDIAVSIAFIFAVTHGFSAEVVQVSWPTAHAAQPLELQQPAANLLPAFRIAIAALPESSIVALALSQPALLGLTENQARELQPLTAQRYRLMASSIYSNAPSALSYCFSAQRPKTGQASVYVPGFATNTTPVILFLHGYGGSFLWYQHYLSENFPKYIIVCPAYGMSTANISQAYVSEALGAVSRKLSFPLSTPSLIGLSAGGFGACRLYVAAPRYYSQMVCLAAYPTDDTISRFSRDLRPRFISGATEAYVTSGDFQRRVDRLRRSCPAVEVATVPNADHFFLLTHPKETVKHLREWLSEPRR